jgi:hypothetical protein
LLPRWGANPLHKDIFIEVESMLKARNEAPTIMTPAVAIMMAQIYADISKPILSSGSLMRRL